MTSTQPHARPAGEKGAFVREMFASIAPRYDLANRVLTGRQDERWRRRAIAVLAPNAHAKILDCCCGTGDLMFGLLRRDPTLTVTGLDFCEPMLERAAIRARRVRGAAQFVQGDVMAMPFPEESFDGATMGFSLRNVVDIDATLREILRVLRPGARFVNLDVSKAPNPIVKRLFDLYFYRVVPLVGGIVGGSRSAYTYLPNSLTHHPNANDLRERFARAGFAEAEYQALMGGTIAIHYGEKAQ
ncbi:MAG: bifunctional demethylmenaquinone methyltransferase/2-methoxy-6-polyprenyl-1,4-benzoquinol methylase UbiE [Candidatus Eremiobacteraeota bacterium]|nr:bifunctional demethylmenaquinone methyltransferase/2-methoxy-6-polyprenyl-1,4-benzoquinol methylase UbiE [Candidatus Eremiobacteraeota bacterium]MBV9055310.1 bifunctional demethylmenaquinone methyltransferase/2-methoxy-6-polyprenyl-1,4-benzoquinol methylase UbiE [Candidatus Eremiobacteraeota bacterium]